MYSSSHAIKRVEGAKNGNFYRREINFYILLTSFEIM